MLNKKKIHPMGKRKAEKETKKKIQYRILCKCKTGYELS